MPAATPDNLIRKFPHRAFYCAARHYRVSKRASRTGGFPGGLVELLVYVAAGRAVEYDFTLAGHIDNRLEEQGDGNGEAIEIVTVLEKTANGGACISDIALVNRAEIPEILG